MVEYWSLYVFITWKITAHVSLFCSLVWVSCVDIEELITVCDRCKVCPPFSLSENKLLEVVVQETSQFTTCCTYGLYLTQPAN